MLCSTLAVVPVGVKSSDQAVLVSTDALVNAAVIRRYPRSLVTRNRCAVVVPTVGEPTVGVKSPAIRLSIGPSPAPRPKT